MDENELKMFIPLLCGVQYEPDIPLSSYYYTLKENYLQVIGGTKEAGVLVIVDTLIMYNIINCTSITPGLYHEVLRILEGGEGNDDYIRCAVKLFCDIMPLFLDTGTVHDIIRLYTVLSATQSSYLTSFLINTLNNSPTAYFLFGGLNNGISVVVDVEQMPQTSYGIITHFMPTRLADGGLPLVFSLNSSKLSLTFVIDNESKHLIVQCYSVGKRLVYAARRHTNLQRRS